MSFAVLLALDRAKQPCEGSQWSLSEQIVTGMHGSGQRHVAWIIRRVNRCSLHAEARKCAMLWGGGARGAAVAAGRAGCGPASRTMADAAVSQGIAHRRRKAIRKGQSSGRARGSRRTRRLQHPVCISFTGLGDCTGLNTRVVTRHRFGTQHKNIKVLGIEKDSSN